MAGAVPNFDTVKVGVCDCFWRPTPTNADPDPDEIYLGLTKGGCELAYTPNWYEIQVDQFGKSLTESVLIGEDVKVKVPLAETDLAKLKLFTHTGTIVTSGAKEKLTFGRRPGLRLAQLSGQIRLHPVAMAGSHEEDVIIYKCVNKAPLQLNYKLDEERIYSTEFAGLVARLTEAQEIAYTESGYLWQIGDPTV